MGSENVTVYGSLRMNADWGLGRVGMVAVTGSTLSINRHEVKIIPVATWLVLDQGRNKTQMRIIT